MNYSTKPNPQSNSGFGMDLTILPGQRSRGAVKLRRREVIRTDVGLK